MIEEHKTKSNLYQFLFIFLEFASLRAKYKLLQIFFFHLSHNYSNHVRHNLCFAFILK